MAEALLRHDFGITYHAAPGHLVPCVPNRVRYVAWAAKVAGDGVTSALDVGCGASCIIALLAARCRGWRVVASESDERPAPRRRRSWPRIRTGTRARSSTSSACVRRPPLNGPSRRRSTRPAARGVDVVVANPPWFESDDERRNACGGAPRRDGAAEATAAETVRDDGEVGFCAALIEDALRLQSRVTWHSALLGRKQSLRRVLALLRERGISRVATTTIDLGRTRAGPSPFPWPRARRRGATRACSPKSAIRPATWPCPRTARFRSSASASPPAPWRCMPTRRCLTWTPTAPSGASASCPAARASTPSFLRPARAARTGRAVPQGAADALARFCDGLPGELARTNRRWRRKLAK